MRLEITRKSDLALKALRVLRGTPARMKARELAKAVDSTPGFITQVLAPLVHEGWVSGAVGPTGGYALEPAGEQVTLRALIEAIEGPIDNGRCVLEDGVCPAPEPCAMHDAWVAARTALLQALEGQPALNQPTAAVAGTMPPAINGRK